MKVNCLSLNLIRLTLAFLFGSSGAYAEAQIEFRGVLGNSGVSGQTLVNFPDRGQEDSVKSGGLALDADGYIWNFAGLSALNRYAIDGRQISQHPLPKAFHRGQRSLALAGNTLVLLADKQLWSLDIHAPESTEPTPLKIPALALSLNSFGGKIAYITPEKIVQRLDVATGQTETVAKLPPNARNRGIAMMPDGTLYIEHSLRLHPDGHFESVKIPGGGPYLQWAGEHLYAFAWHTTIHQLNAEGHASPGVVYGGSSGAFIGTLPKDGELQFPSGIVHLGDNRFALTAENNVIHIVKWNTSSQSFDAVRRLGAIHRAAGLAIDPQGRIWWNTGYWDWTDRPSAILKNTTWSARRDNDAWQVDTLASGALTGLGTDRSNPSLIRNVVDSTISGGRGGDGRYDRKGVASIKELPAAPTGAAAIGPPGKEELIVVDAQGNGVRIRVDPQGNARGLVAAIRLELESQQPSVTSLAHTDAGELFAADGGAIVRLVPSTNGFREVARYTDTSNDGSAFGSRIFIDGDGDLLWVSDTEHNRIVVIEPRPEHLHRITNFEGNSASGALQSPERIAVTNGRAVVLDWINQRLVRLELKPE